jgi:hypothetical protein
MASYWELDVAMTTGEALLLSAGDGDIMSCGPSNAPHTEAALSACSI